MTGGIIIVTSRNDEEVSISADSICVVRMEDGYLSVYTIVGKIVLGGVTVGEFNQAWAEALLNGVDNITSIFTKLELNE